MPDHDTTDYTDSRLTAWPGQSKPALNSISILLSQNSPNLLFYGMPLQIAGVSGGGGRSEGKRLNRFVTSIHSSSE